MRMNATAADQNDDNDDDRDNGAPWDSLKSIKPVGKSFDSLTGVLSSRNDITASFSILSSVHRTISHRFITSFRPFHVRAFSNIMVVISFVESFLIFFCVGAVHNII